MNGEKPFFLLDRGGTTMLKGIAITFVLLGHTGYYSWGGAGGVALFLMLSGFGINLSFEQSGRSLYWNKRIRKVWLPYFFVGLLDAIILQVQEKRRLLCTILGLDFGLIADKTMWYISFILLWYLAFYLLSFPVSWIQNRRAKELVKMVGLAAAALLFRWLYGKGVWHSSSGAGLYAFAFPIGVFLSILSRWNVKESFTKCAWFAILFACAAYLTINYHGVYSATKALTMAVQPLAVFQLAEVEGRTRKALLWLGRYSYPLYLFEGLLLGVRNSLFAIMSLQPLIDLTCFAVAALAAVVYQKVYRQLERSIPFDKIIKI